MEIVSIILVCVLVYFIVIRLSNWFDEGYRANDSSRSGSKPFRPRYQSRSYSKQELDQFKKKGDEFENYIVSLFPRNANFTLIDWRSDKVASNGMYALSSLNPDLEFGYKDDYCNHRFAIECKWRANFIQGCIEWAKEQQIINYRNYERSSGVPVFVAIGVGGVPSSPDILFFVPLREVERYPVVYKSHLNKFARNSRQLFSFDTKTGLVY